MLTRTTVTAGKNDKKFTTLVYHTLAVNLQISWWYVNDNDNDTSNMGQISKVLVIISHDVCMRVYGKCGKQQYILLPPV